MILAEVTMQLDKNGAGFIMISAAYYQHFVDCHVCDERFIDMAKAFGRQDADQAQDFLKKVCQIHSENILAVNLI